MAKAKKKNETTVPKVLTYEEKVELLWDEFKRNQEISLLPEPTMKFEIGQEVSIGNLLDCVIKDVLLDGKVYLISYTNKKKNSLREDVFIPNTLMFYSWLGISHKESENTVSFFNEERLRIHYSQVHLMALWQYVYGFGVNFNAEYQRGDVWDQKDKEALIESIFQYVDIGKFAFIENSSKKWAETGYSYEILDGKQRLTTLCEFYEGKFTYKGKTYKELSQRDRDFIRHYPVSVAKFDDLSEKDALSYFIRMNKHGRVMDPEHLKKIEKDYEYLLKEKK